MHCMPQPLSILLIPKAETSNKCFTCCLSVLFFLHHQLLLKNKTRGDNNKRTVWICIGKFKKTTMHFQPICLGASIFRWRGVILVLEKVHLFLQEEIIYIGYEQKLSCNFHRTKVLALRNLHFVQYMYYSQLENVAQVSDTVHVPSLLKWIPLMGPSAFIFIFIVLIVQLIKWFELHFPSLFFTPFVWWTYFIW